ncbi:MAG: hypothetical protein ACLRPS_08075 [Paraprevotella clara]|uniref:NVEALA protein n=1 Tax=Paraprevotella clara TaxID=454154 RepID=A0A6N3DZZ9_9BACT
MKKIKLMVIGVLTLSSAYVGYSVYDDMNAPISDEFYLEDVEALASDSEAGGSDIRDRCHCSNESTGSCSPNNSGGDCGMDVDCSQRACV